MIDHIDAQTPRPTCQAANPSLCSNCNLAYDCGRVRGRRTLSWGIVALGIAGLMAVIAQRMA
jgi:hypothetical protein